MYQNMRRKDRLLPPEKSRQLLEEGNYGVLSTVGANGQPYGVPVNYVVLGNWLYFHCAQAGQKLDNLAHEPRACFCVVTNSDPVFTTDFTTHYTSVVVYGRTQLVKEPEEKWQALMDLCRKYLPEHMDRAQGSIESSLERTAVVKLSLDHITGKQNPAGQD